MLFEDDAESKERDKFEKTKEYKKWKKENPHLTSWNYGLSIEWDNDPEKVNFNELEDNNSVDSELESPTLIQKLLRAKLFFRIS